MLAELVREHCDIVATVASATAVLEQVTSTLPNVVLLGVSFDGTSGFEVARHLLASGCRAKVIFISLYESRDLVHAALAIGASGYVFLSRLLDDLPMAINAACEGHVFEPRL